MAPPSSAAASKDHGAPAVTRAVAVLRLLARSDEPLGVNAIAKALGLAPSTCLHILRALAAETLVRADSASKLYTLDAGILPLAQRLMQRDDFSRRVGAYLDDIAAGFGVTAVGVRVAGLRQMVVLALSQPPAVFRLQVDIGSHFPSLISATGRCYAAFGGAAPGELRRAFVRLKWDDPPGYEEWMSEVAEARRTGFSVDAGRYIRGITIVAAPVFDRDGVMSHGLATIGLGAQIQDGEVAEIGEALKTAGEALSLGRP